MKITEKEWLEDFKDFVSAEGASVPEDVSRRILRRIHAEMSPSPWIVFLKLLGIHLVVGTLSLAICNQFGLNPFHTGFSLSEYFMKFGHSACMFLCGVLFIGLTISLCQIFMNRDEFRVLARNVFLQVFVLAVFSLVAFIGFGAEVVFGIGLLWLMGAMVGGVITTKALISRPSFS